MKEIWCGNDLGRKEKRNEGRKIGQEDGIDWGMTVMRRGGEINR